MKIPGEKTVSALFGQLWNRFFGGLKVHIRAVSQAGDLTHPALCFDISVENNMGEGSHLRGFKVRLVEPVAIETEDVVLRMPNKPVVIEMPINIGPWQSSPRINPLIVKFPVVLDKATGRY